MSDPSYSDENTPNAFTQLRLNAIGVPPYSARGLKQSWSPIDQAAQMKRTVNGIFKDISFDGFRKIKTTISGEDQEPPAVDDVWPGLQVTVDCIFELSYVKTRGNPSRPAVSGSERDSGNYRLYRPQLVCLITNYSCERDEYGAAVSWSMDLEEV
jgi:hypothetical protein